MFGTIRLGFLKKSIMPSFQINPSIGEGRGSGVPVLRAGID
jgi:hypothetical protein